METSLLELQSVDPDEAAPNVGGSMQAGRFYRSLAGVVAFGLAFRVGYVLLVTRHENKAFYDAYWYAYTAEELKSGHFFTLGHSPTAAHPPLTSLILGAVNLVAGFNPGATAMRLTMAFLGAAVVLCVGLLGRSIAGPWVGLTAAALAAVYPNMWMPSGILMSETPAMLVTAFILLAIVRIYRSPTLGNAALLGVLCGAGALVRAELILFVPCLLLPAVLAARKISARRRLKLLGIGLLATGIVLAPWVGRNLATFQDPTYLTTSDGGVLLGANCPATYGHWALGYWYPCPQSLVDSGSGDESVISARYASRALKYASDHQFAPSRRSLGANRSDLGPLCAYGNGERRTGRRSSCSRPVRGTCVLLRTASIRCRRHRHTAPPKHSPVVPARTGRGGHIGQRGVLRDLPLQDNFRGLPGGVGSSGVGSVDPMVGPVCDKKTRSS